MTHDVFPNDAGTVVTWPPADEQPSYVLTLSPLLADYWRFLLPGGGACEIRWHGHKPTVEDVQIAMDVLMLAKHALKS